MKTKPPPPPPPALEKRRQPGGVPAVFLAIVVHAVFFALIVFGVTWSSKPPDPVEVEIWDKLPPAKVSKAPDPQPNVEPEPPKPEPPKPDPPKPEPIKAPKPDVKPAPPKVDPKIALKAERELREKEKKEKAEREKKKDDEAKKKREKEDAEKKKREDEKKRLEEEKARIAAAEKAREIASARQSEIDSWKRRISDRIKSKANVPDTVTGNPAVQVQIRILPGGEVLDITVTRASGNPTYDSAIERGIRSASPLPVPPANSELFPQFRELNLILRHER